MTKSIQLARDLDLPQNAVTQGFAFLGRQGSWKTYAAGIPDESVGARGPLISRAETDRRA